MTILVTGLSLFWRQIRSTFCKPLNSKEGKDKTEVTVVLVLLDYVAMDRCSLKQMIHFWLTMGMICFFPGLAAPVGGAVAGVVLVAIIIIIACYLIRRKKSGKDKRALTENSNRSAPSNIRSQVRVFFFWIKGLVNWCFMNALYSMRCCNAVFTTTLRYLQQHYIVYNNIHPFSVTLCKFLSSHHLCFIIVFICDLFVSRDDPLKLRARLGSRKTGLSPPVF